MGRSFYRVSVPPVEEVQQIGFRASAFKIVRDVQE